MIKLELDRKRQLVIVKEPADVTSLHNGFYGHMKKGMLFLSPEEALYIMDIRNGRCYDEAGNSYNFNDLCIVLSKEKLLAKYLTYKDWRDKGLVLREISEIQGNYGRSSMKKYMSSDFSLPAFSFNGLFFHDDLLTIVDDEKAGKELYEHYWIGQFGTYKASHRGNISKLDIYETIFLTKYGKLNILNSKLKNVLKTARERIEYSDDIYAVYEDWRARGYIIKTGFKFGTHFRIYFPGASPLNSGKGDWVHSKHVIHVFSRKAKLLISEWSRAIRVAHSVRKTFILAIPGKRVPIKVNPKKPRLDFLLYHRKQDGIETPKEGMPKYLMYSLTEDEYIGGEELAKALAECAYFGLEMMMAISDRESSVTYYAIKRIELPGSEYEYFEIEWVQP
jgi:tRNA-intron endonuclease